MKLGLISDIHADWRALERAVTTLNEQHHVDAIWCAGDVVGRGRYPDEVVQYLAQHDIPTVMGNHDELALTPLRSRYGRYFGQQVGVGESALRWLATLPRTYRARLGGRTVVMVHGTPRSNSEGLGIQPNRVEQHLQWLNRVAADVLVVGHTHTPMRLQNRHGIIVNPGSLFNPAGFQRASSQTFGVLELDGLAFKTFPLWESAAD